ncbi:MAG: ABC transporter ATP-binding protein [Magnetovibrionaceae bacterium]
MMANMNKRVPVLDIQGLSVEFKTRSGIVHALEHVSFDVFKGEMVGIVGESGSGKSVSALTALGILDEAGRVTAGSITLGGLDILKAKRRELQAMRGSEASMIFQSPRTALNPIRTVGKQIGDVLRRHGFATRSNMKEKVVDALKTVRIPDPERRAEAYPFELSGGMCQRIMIAMALSCQPELLIADEPTTGLDVTTQAAIMDLIKDLARERNMATLLITHDLAMAADYCDRIVVMHAGHVVERAASDVLFESPRHPYTQKLMKATPRNSGTLDDISSIDGGVPDLRRDDLPACRFSARCDRYDSSCDPAPLLLDILEEAHAVACRRPL